MKNIKIAKIELINYPMTRSNLTFWPRIEFQDYRYFTKLLITFLVLVTLENWCFIDVLRTFGSYNPFIIALSELRFTRTYFFKKKMHWVKFLIRFSTKWLNSQRVWKFLRVFLSTEQWVFWRLACVVRWLEWWRADQIYKVTSS